MKKIRKNVFETNSSSTHSICIAEGTKEHLTELPGLDKNGNLKIDCGEYGWEEAAYGFVADRLDYAATYMLNYGKQHKEMFEEIVKKYTGANEIIYPEGDDWGDQGYIDHQSVEEASEIFESESNLEQFLFNPASSFETDNDNH